MNLSNLFRNGAVLITALFSASICFGISRIGGGVSSEISNFQTQVPDQFIGGNVNQGKSVNPNVIILKDAFNSGFQSLPGEILLAEFSERFASWISKDPGDFEIQMLSEGFAKMTLPLIPCAQGWYLSSPAQNGYDASEHMVIRLGSSQGVSIDATSSQDVLVALKEIQESIKLLQGTCSWK